MKVTKIYTPQDTIRRLTSTEVSLAQQILSDNLALKQKDHLLIVTDPKMLSTEAALWFEAGKTITSHAQLVVFSGMTENAQEPPGLVGLMMTRSKVVILQTTFSLSHTNARFLATKRGARIASLPGATHNLIMRTLNVDYQPIKLLSHTLKRLLDQANQALITATNGTHLKLTLENRQAIADTGYLTLPGSFGNLPAGEAFIAPVEGSAQGTIVIDGAVAGIKLDRPITIIFKDGLATDITGGQAAKELAGQLNKVGPTARNLAELGIGTNKKADPTGPLIEAEKAHGTVHIALGSNATFGGTVSIPFHSDGVIMHPTLLLDSRLILKQGRFNL